jgi:tRNA threonylcarbamoyladenosine biosynthesis protein TsaB
MILNIESATEVCSVALADQGKLIAIRESPGRDHASLLAVFIDEVIREAKFSLKDINAVAVSRGPGSYTGLRIGVASAKGICYALNKPLIAIDTLKSMANSFLLDNHETISSDFLLIPMIDARRMEVYGAVLDQDLNYVSPIVAEVLNSQSFLTRPQLPRVLFGDGAVKAMDVIKGESLVKVVPNFTPSAKGLISLSLNAFNQQKFENIAYFEPYYLKEFVSSK